MVTELEKSTDELKQLILNEDLKMPDISGVTPLLKKAQLNATMSPLSPEKKFEEMVVCNLVGSFSEFHQVNFSELESYISVSEFSLEKMLEALKGYVEHQAEKEDIILKACVARAVQRMEPRGFSAGFLEQRFPLLRKLDPWLFAELILNVNYVKGVDMITSLLQTDYDASYLFALIPQILKGQSNEELSVAFSKWNQYFNGDDKELAAYYAENYGFKILTHSVPSTNAAPIRNEPPVSKKRGNQTTGQRKYPIKSSSGGSKTKRLKFAADRINKLKELNKLNSGFAVFVGRSSNTARYRSLNSQKKSQDNNKRTLENH
ncbi:hypothetical protein [Mucilaginibacter pedocola]|uniref:Uncharacterized protein n=1 Tax=Mucilaginibacter pedocola TaxID=1792845 RepID=A0A1S9PBB8_9SPHI|nr:hypothetical protein [Mucilaginibacter pedocola]OOQ58276.1 hypothetical protein BC343_11620 [Mucilaginibacter pedocola]